MPATADGTLLVIGGTGELGRATVAAACADSGWKGPVLATYHSAPPSKELRASAPRAEWAHLDCSDHKTVRALLVGPRRVTAIAYCAVPKHRGANEDGSAGVRAGIVDDVVSAAEAAAMVGARFVALSTDLVFDGALPPGERYAEDAPLSPAGAYGRFKADMEAALRAISGSIVIARSSLILSVDETGAGRHGKAVRFVVDAVNGLHGQIELFEDELRCMAFADDLGAALVELASPECGFAGTIHVVSDEVANRWELAKKLARKFGMENMLGVHATSGLSKNSGMNRPLNCALGTAVNNRVLKTKIRGITERLS